MANRRPISVRVMALFLAGAIAAVSIPHGWARQPSDSTTALPRGLRPHVFAVVGGKVATAPGQFIEKCTVVVRGGRIDTVGADLPAPADAVVIDAAGKFVYPGLIDASSTWGIDVALKRSEAGPAAAEDIAAEPLIATKRDNRKGLTPEFSVATALKKEEEFADGWRKTGFTARLAAPEGAIFAGQSALVSLNGGSPHESVIAADLAQHVSLRPPGAGDYPRAHMGAVAHARQFCLDSQRFGRLGPKATDFEPALATMQPALAGKQVVVFEADDRDEILRALDFAKDFHMRPLIFGGREAWKVADRLKAENVAVIIRMAFAEPNEEREKNLPLRAQLERNRIRWEERQNPGKLHAAGVRIAFGSQGLGERAPEKFLQNICWAIRAGLPEEAALRALTESPANLLGRDLHLGAIAPGNRAHLVIADGGQFKPKTKVVAAVVDGTYFNFQPPTDETAKKPEQSKKEDELVPPLLPDTFIGPLSPADLLTEIETDRRPTIKTGGSVLIKGATLVTVSRGNLRETNLLVRDGKIAAVGADAAANAPGTMVIDAKGMFVMPGIIDSHAHFAVQGSVNEFSLSVVPEVRIADVIDGDDVQIYRSAAGGVTTARILHGSANCVGGQDAVIKMKYGKPGRELIVPGAPRGIKFALGENVKRTDGRFPNTRLGVEAVFVRAFTEAREYQQLWDGYRAALQRGETPAEPRRDLRLEALADILRGDLRVHCHCYRADEILMLLRVADRFGFKIRSLQHVLEGYKIAPEIAAHGASCSLFSDWWAYKIESYDAIPYAAALLHEAGATVCLKSDSNELVRHLYQEAAKLVKYGGLSEEEALRAITLNPAKQLGLDGRLGSIEVGKDADLAIFNGHPLNSFARVELTLVEGEVVFQRGKSLVAAPVAATPPARPAPKFELPPANGRDLIVTGATVHPVTGSPIVNGTVVVRNGKIASLGRPDTFPGATIVHADGLHVYPGMIDAGTVVGLAELESAKETLDFREGGDFQPDLRAGIAINPDSEYIPVTRANGVLTVVTRPTGSMIAGQSVLLNLAGWVPREMTVVDPLALHVEFPSSSPFFAIFDPTISPMARGMARKQRDERIRRLKGLFVQAKAYDAGRRAKPPTLPINTRLEALAPYAKGEKPVVVQAQRMTEIKDALKMADELKIKIILSGALDSWKVAEEIKKHDVPVILGPTMAMPQEREDPYDAPFACAAKLHQAGVRFCVRSEGASNTRNLPYQAAMAVSYGLPAEEGLKAVTIYPAQILGVADQLGSIEEGRRANLVITNGDILQASTQVLAIAIDGKLMAPESKQTRLYDRYRQRLREVKQGTAPLGTGR